ncbi:PRC-barrel domain-containing protein [Gemmobacter serpentinus]|uniref:PRC-barrel domain-containing protein n=1 Tax=Gemmobacter serpentinus TaxID=2652247 RepID=UPI0018656D6C|nr:PRC-barrel domain-containing protein [Gemmobacter serpentinus]
MKTLLASTALALGLSGAVWAQTATDAPLTPPVETAPAEMPAAPMAEAPTTEIAPQTGIAAMTEEQIVGHSVEGADGSSVGSVSEVTKDANGAINGVVIDVGGFLGLGAKPVALTAADLMLVPGTEGAPPVLKVAMTEEQLKALPEYQG